MSKALQDQTLDTQKKIYALGGSISQDYATAATAQGNAAIGQGLQGLGNLVSSNYNTINRLTNYFSSGSSSQIPLSGSSSANYNVTGALY